MDNDIELRARLHLWRASGIGSATINRLLGYFGQASLVLNASHAELSKAGLKPEVIEELRSLPEDAAQADLDWLAHSDRRHILLDNDPRYPQLLKRISSPPPVLFVVGDPTILNDPQLAMVGSRNPTRSGQETAHAFAQHLAQNGLTITSGLATGIDTHSHQGALAGQGQTIAVVATGLDIVYPASNRKLAEQIVEQGAIISEFPIGVKPQAQNFPRRNRMISGLSLGTLVVEAALQSGSLVTTKHAMEQGREVFAIPGSIHNPLTRGCHQLIRQGGKLVETAHDIIEELAPQLMRYLGEDFNPSLENDYSKTPQKQLFLDSNHHSPSSLPDELHPSELGEQEQQIINTLGNDPIPIDQIVMQTGLTTESVSSMLLMLELQGHIAACGGGHYMRLTPRDEST